MHPTYRPEVDGLRALAVLAILLHHAGVPFLPGGYLGVDVFFVISGYVITRLMLADIEAATFTLKGFWTRRVRRILPALVVLLAVCLPLAWVMMSSRQMEDFLPVFLGATAMVPNIVLWGNVGYFTQWATTRPLLHLWSLGVEEQFYLLYPVLLWGLWRAGMSETGRRWVLRGLGLLSLVLAAWLVVAAPTAGFFLLPSRIWELVLGALVATSGWQPGSRARQIWSLLGLILILVSLLVYGPKSPGPATLPPVLGAALCILAARSDTWVGQGLALGPLVWIGRISFGAYLWHWPLLAFTRIHLAEEPALALKLALMALAIALGWLSWRFVETPFRRKEAPILPRFGIGAGLLSMGLLAAAGGLVMLAEDRDWRQLRWPGMQIAEKDAIRTERHRWVRSGSCHLANSTDPFPPFRAGWNCPAASADGLKGWPVALFGDSNGADVAMVLRMTGRNPMQMTLWGCSVVPSHMRPDCRLAADDLRAAAKGAGLKVVVLANLWQPFEATPEALVELELWWGEVFDTVVLVGPLPRFEALDERFLRWPRERVAKLTPDFELAEAFAAARRRVAGSELVVIDATALFCGDRPGCSPLGEGPLMLDDWSHLSREGARGYADRLAATGVLERLVP